MYTYANSQANIFIVLDPKCNSDSPGWSGEMCLGYDCSGVDNCYGNGLCVGPNICKCNNGWSGQQCINALCSNVNNCSDHGFCILPDICLCSSTYTGENCSTCIPSHWGARCEPCPNCQNGNVILIQVLFAFNGLFKLTFVCTNKIIGVCDDYYAT
ncbi:unnamed protein product [Mytilus coruscus]|uniref:EGF-like domain-containing protein n=1 Tax=Mytilus coruscus TaxID=42192 RepID=A0A6J8EKJ1_MYTCO|nr:unnamed protein product [Mytilus coruscus]